LIIFLCLLLIHVLFTFCGFYGNDDINYARFASIISNKSHPENSFTDHFSLRWVPIYVTSFFYYLFGINAISSALFSVASFIFTAIILYQFLKKENFFTQLIAYVLFFFNYSIVFYTHRLLPDSGICFFNLVAYYIYYRQRFYEKKATHLHAFLLSICLMLAVLTKETVIILFPFWIFLLVVDFLAKRNYLFWLLSLLFLLIEIFFYLLFFKLTTGEWLFRYNLLQSATFLHGATYGDYPFIETLKRLLYQLWEAFMLNGDLEYLLFSFTGVIYLKSIFKNEKTKQIAISFLVLLLASNFMTFTPTAYSPLWPDTRHFLFIIPFASLTGAYMFRAYMKEPRRFMLVLVFFLITDIFLFFSAVRGTKYIYFLITLLLLIRLLEHLYKKKIKHVKLSLYYFFFAGIMSINFLYDFILPQYPYYFDQKKIIQSQFLNESNKCLVYTGDRQTAEMGDFFLSFDNQYVQFVNIDTCKDFSLENERHDYLLVNGGYNPLFKYKIDSLIQNNYLDSSLHEVQKVTNSVLYEIKNKDALFKLQNYATIDF
jgi:hypothetical protein